MMGAAQAVARPAVRLTLDDAVAAAMAWGFNCGPGALCGVASMTPDQVRPHLGEFEAKGYTNPSMMAHALLSLGVRFQRSYTASGPHSEPGPYAIGLRLGAELNALRPLSIVRIQWAGSWTKPGVPMGARYRRTHWVGIYDHPPAPGQPLRRDVFDVNALGSGGWVSMDDWAGEVVPAILRDVKGATGEWWPTNVWGVM